MEIVKNWVAQESLNTSICVICTHISTVCPEDSQSQPVQNLMFQLSKVSSNKSSQK